MSGAPGDRTQFASTAWFEVHVGSETWAVVQSVAGLEESFEMKAWHGGGQHDDPENLPGNRLFTNVVLQGVVSDTKKFFDWFAQVKLGSVGAARKNVSIMLMHQTSGGPKVTGQWDLAGAFPVRYTAPSLDRTKETVALEKVELVHKGIKRAS